MIASLRNEGIVSNRWENVSWQERKATSDRERPSVTSPGPCRQLHRSLSGANQRSEDERGRRGGMTGFQIERHQEASTGSQCSGTACLMEHSLSGAADLEPLSYAPARLTGGFADRPVGSAAVASAHPMVALWPASPTPCAALARGGGCAAPAGGSANPMVAAPPTHWPAPPSQQAANQRVRRPHGRLHRLNGRLL